MPDEVVTKTPNEELAEQIKDALCEAGLVSERHEEQVLRKLTAGNASSEDWNLWIDIATDPEKKENPDE